MTNVAEQTGSGNVSSDDRDIRVEDYLNDKLQTYADLDNLDSLLQNVKDQQALLKQQLVEADLLHNESKRKLEEHSTGLVKRIDIFHQQQKNIDRRLLIVTQSETSDDAVKKFDASMEKLRRLEVAKYYVDLLAHVDHLSAEARRNFRASPQAALEPYLQLKKLATALVSAQPAAEDAAVHLVDHVEATVSILWAQMKADFSAEFELTLKKFKWPSKTVNLGGQLEAEWETGVKRLLDLQEPELSARETESAAIHGSLEPLVLLPLEVMVKPLEMRFKYHFDGDRPTNKIDKPEYFLSHIISLLNTYNDFFDIYLQPVLRSHFKGSNLALHPIYIDSTSALITALLPMVRRKLDTLLPQVGKQPQLLSHLIHELMNFDNSLKDDWSYTGESGAEGWKGLTWEVLVKKEWFGKWLRVEKSFALSRYKEINEKPDSAEIDYESVDPGSTKPTKAAIRVNDLLETVTDRYRPLYSFSQKLHFLIDVQIAIFDEFHGRLHSALEAYLVKTSAIARVQGVSKEEQAELQGLGGLERLCRVYGSAEYLERKMRDWSDDVFFLELWDDLQDRARGNPQSEHNFAGEMTVSDVAERTSSVVGSDEDTGALFDETAGAYRQLRIRTEGIIQDMIIHNIRDSLRPYSRINPWSSLSSDLTNPSSFSITAELDNSIQQVSSHLTFLAKVLAEAPLRRVGRQITLSIQSILWDGVLMRHSFSASGIAQFTRDLIGIWDVIDHSLGTDQGALGMRKLNESLELLRLPAEPRVTSDTETEVAHDALGLDLWQVEKRVFRSNESARDVLEELGLEILTESEARHVLERRIEMGNR